MLSAIIAGTLRIKLFGEGSDMVAFYIIVGVVFIAVGILGFLREK